MKNEEIEKAAKEFENKLKRHPTSRGELQNVLTEFGKQILSASTKEPVKGAEELKQLYVNHFGNKVNFSGESGDFTAKLLYEIFDWFLTNMQPKQNERLNELKLE